MPVAERTGPVPLRYLSSAELDQCLPDVDTRLELATTALSALSRGGAEMPAKIGVHPRPGALLHAMPAWLRAGDLVGLKWVSAYPDNNIRGLPATNALVMLNDAETGVVTWIMDGTRITAIRTAAVSGVALRLLRPDRVDRIALVGAGVQARSHIEVIGALAPDAELVIYDHHPERAEAVAAEARTAGRSASVAGSAEEAAGSARVVITMARLGSASQIMGSDWLAPGTLVIAVDFDTHASAELARSARMFAVDDRDQFLALRAAGRFDGYPDPTTTIGELIDGAGGPGEGHMLVNHLGIGLADVVFANDIAHRAMEQGLGMELPR